MIASDHRLGGTISGGDLKERRRKGRTARRWKRSRNMPGGPSRSLILMDRSMSGGTRYNTLMNGRSILARSNAKSIFNYPTPAVFAFRSISCSTLTLDAQENVADYANSNSDIFDIQYFDSILLCIILLYHLIIYNPNYD